MVKIRIQMNDIKESVPVKDGYYLLVVVDDPIEETEKIVPAELCDGKFYKFEGLSEGLLGVAAGVINLADLPEIYDSKDILAWGKIPENWANYWNS